jgi:hypothetical protein
MRAGGEGKICAGEGSNVGAAHAVTITGRVQAHIGRLLPAVATLLVRFAVAME